MGGGRGKVKRVAASLRKYADEYNLYATHARCRYREVWELTRAEASEAGRDPDSIFWTSAGPGLAAKSDADYRRLLDLFAEITGQTTEHIETTYEERGYPHGSGSKATEMLTALEEAGCQRYFPQLFIDEVSDMEIIMEAYQG